MNLIQQAIDTLRDDIRLHGSTVRKEERLIYLQTELAECTRSELSILKRFDEMNRPKPQLLQRSFRCKCCGQIMRVPIRFSICEACRNDNLSETP